MAQQTINVGTAPNDGTGTPLRTAFQYTNSNFSELYTAVGPSGNNIVVPGNATITGDLTVNSNVNIGASPAFYGGKIATNGSIAIAGGNYLKLWNSTGTGVAGINAGAADTLTFSLTNAFTTAMILNSTGLGIGVGPSYPFHLRNSAAAIGMIHSTNANGPYVIFQNSTANFGDIGSETAITGGGSAGNLTLNSRSTSNLCFSVNDTVRMRIDTSGNVGIGVTPSAWTLKSLQIVAGGIYGSGNETGYYANAFYGSSGWRYINSAGASGYLQNGGSHQWYRSTSANVAGTDPVFSQAMTLDASGNLLVGTTSLASNEKLSVVTGNTTGAVVKNTGGATYSPLYVWNATTTGDGYFSAFFTEASATLRGSITYNRAVGQVSYNITSDYRLKDDIKPLVGALNRISSLKPSTYNLKETGFTCEGFIAHELAEVIPSAVTGEKDAVNEDGSIKPQQVDLSKVIPVLVAAIKELTAEVNALKNA